MFTQRSHPRAKARGFPALPHKTGKNSFHQVELTKRIRATNLLRILRRQIDIEHLKVPGFEITTRDGSRRFYPGNGRRTIYVSDGAMIRILSTRK